MSARKDTLTENSVEEVIDKIGVIWKNIQKETKKNMLMKKSASKQIQQINRKLERIGKQVD